MSVLNVAQLDVLLVESSVTHYKIISGVSAIFDKPLTVASLRRAVQRLLV